MSEKKKKQEQGVITVTADFHKEISLKLGKEDGVSWTYLLKKLLEKAGY
jgi:hypothetical protein